MFFDKQNSMEKCTGQGNFFFVCLLKKDVTLGTSADVQGPCCMLRILSWYTARCRSCCSIVLPAQFCVDEVS